MSFTTSQQHLVDILEDLTSARVVLRVGAYMMNAVLVFVISFGLNRA